MLVAVTSRFRSGDIELARDETARTVRCLKQAARDVDFASHYGDRLRPIRWRRFSAVHLRHERGPGRRGEHAALRVILDLLWPVKAHPRAGNEVGGVADEPDVGSIVRRSGFSARRIV